MSLASSSQSSSVRSVHSSEAHYSSAQRPGKDRSVTPSAASPASSRHLLRTILHSLGEVVILLQSGAALIIINCGFSWTNKIQGMSWRNGLYSLRRPDESRGRRLLLWPPWCRAVTWLRLIPLRSSESCSLILPTLCPTFLHNLPSPNFPYRSHWLSFVCVWMAHSRLLARGCRQRAEGLRQLTSISHEARGGLSSQVCFFRPASDCSFICKGDRWCWKYWWES